MTDDRVSQNDQPVDGRLELLARLSTVRRSLQKWHANLRRQSGDSAADIFRTQGRILNLLAHTGEMRQQDLRAELGIRPQSLYEVLTKLERAGYVTRRASQSDRRMIIVAITPAGLSCIQGVKVDLPFSTFTDAEIRQFISYLDRAIADIDRVNADASRTAGTTGKRTGGSDSSGTMA